MENLTGMKFGKLTALSVYGRNKNGRRLWECECECQNKTIIYVETSNLINNKTKSCGCINKLPLGMTKKTQKAWNNMKQRCTNPKHKWFHHYGGRGIKVCDKWLNDSSKFYEDMGNCPEEFSLERIDNNGNYCKENCIWIPTKEQLRNQRRTKLSMEKAREIRYLFTIGYTKIELAQMYNVHHAGINTIIKNIYWKENV